MKTEIISIKKLKKDGSIDASIARKVINFLSNGKIVLMPVDNIYGLMCSADGKASGQLSKLVEEKEIDLTRMISSFKMLDEIAYIDKLQFDFLHRIWPGELVVYLLDIKNQRKTIPIRMPKSVYLQEIIDEVGSPLYYGNLRDNRDNLIYRKNEILKLLKDKIDLKVIIDEFCKEHAYPTVVDISKGDLNIINEGRVSADEIKSLYFLGKDDLVI